MLSSPNVMFGVARIHETETAPRNRNRAPTLTQGSINGILEQIFGIQTGFVGNVTSQAVKAIGFRGAAEQANDKHMDGWSEMCKKAGVLNTPLTPYIDAELLAHNHLSVSGRMIESTGFMYAFPQLTEESLRPQLATYIQQGLFPAVG
jgi:hypothetical protein